MRTASHRQSLFGALLLGAVLMSDAALAADSAQLALGKKIFTQSAVPACAVCHALKDSGSQGAVGPSLDELKPGAARVAKALRDGIGQMPSYKATLNEAQIQAVAAYVAAATGASK
jgi:sulfite dehydrogenase